MSKQEQVLRDVVTEHLVNFETWRKTKKFERQFMYITPAKELQQLEEIATFPLECVVFSNSNHLQKKVKEKVDNEISPCGATTLKDTNILL